tara:strand:+ start:8459 stop:9301 length:843 start_codon:yes stop_codon:yes gene_type:complete
MIWPLVSPDWLQKRIGDTGVVVVDASWHMPAAQRDARAEFAAGHIPGAVFFDIDACSDHDSGLPHMLPTPEVFSDYAGQLGISDNHNIVVYDTVGLFSAARAWWTMRAFGAAHVFVLDGGLPAWRAAGLPVETGVAKPDAASFNARPAQGVASIDAVQAALDRHSAQVVDARGASRFSGAVAEPRPGLRSGHMPGALNVPFDRLIDGGRMRPPEAIEKVFAEAGLAPEEPVITTCGSGVTAAIVSLALACISRDSLLYDGSWSEWGGDSTRKVVSAAPSN